MNWSIIPSRLHAKVTHPVYTFPLSCLRSSKPTRTRALTCSDPPFKPTLQSTPHMIHGNNHMINIEQSKFSAHVLHRPPCFSLRSYYPIRTCIGQLRRGTAGTRTASPTSWNWCTQSPHLTTITVDKPTMSDSPYSPYAYSNRSSTPRLYHSHHYEDLTNATEQGAHSALRLFKEPSAVYDTCPTLEWTHPRKHTYSTKTAHLRQYTNTFGRTQSFLFNMDSFERSPWVYDHCIPSFGSENQSSYPLWATNHVLPPWHVHLYNRSGWHRWGRLIHLMHEHIEPQHPVIHRCTNNQYEQYWNYPTYSTGRMRTAINAW